MLRVEETAVKQSGNVSDTLLNKLYHFQCQDFDMCTAFILYFGEAFPEQ